MPAIATLEELKAVKNQLENFRRSFPEAYQHISEIFKANRRIGYKNICKMLMGEATPEELKSESKR